MLDRRSRLAVNPPLILLVAAAVELAIFRIAVREMQSVGSPQEGAAPAPPWLVYLGLVVFYFAMALGVGVLLVKLIDMVKDQKPYRTPVAIVLALACLSFLGFGSAAMLATPTQSTSFLLESSFAAALLVLLGAQLTVRGDLGARIGIVLLAMPLLVHYGGQFYLRYVGGEEALWNGFDLRVENLGLWSLVFAAMVTPYCFAPRPFVINASRLLPLAVGTGAGLVAALFIRLDQGRAADWARWAIGIDIGEKTPLAMLGLYLLALSAIAWTLCACLTAPSRARRQIGVGLGLVVVSGYSYAWPLQHLLSLTGLATIALAAVRVVAEEQSLSGYRRARGPAIDDSVWARFVKNVVSALREGDGHEEDADDVDGDSKPNARTATVTVKGDQNLARTYVVSRRNGIPIKVRIEREELPGGRAAGGSSLLSVEVQCGEPPPEGSEPAWTLCLRPEPNENAIVHPAPPATSAPVINGGDGLDGHFRIRDRGGFTDKLLDSELRNSIGEQIHGWMAYWPNRTIAYRVYPGIGAPIDRPIPITDLAFRGDATSVERLLQLVDFLAAVSTRAGLVGAPVAAHSDELDDGAQPAEDPAATD